MKIVAVVNLLAIVCVAAGMDPVSVVNAVQSSVWKVPRLVHRHVEKRQTLSNLTNEEFTRCESVAVDSQCSSGYAQAIINVELRCGNMASARDTSLSCARNEGGQACGAAVLDLSVNDNQTQNAATCSGAVTQGSCPSTCRSFLQFARSMLGCCVNTYVNTTDSSVYFQYREYVDYRLWNLCNVDLPPADCGNALPVNPPSNVQTCTGTEYIRRITNHVCMPSVGQPLINALLRTSRCYPLARLFVDVCATNANGDFCLVLNQDVLSNGSTNLFTALDSCGVSTSTCTSSCRNTVSDARNTLGCCVNTLYNNSQGIQLPALSNSYWNLCGVETPGFCTSTLNSATTMKGIAWLIVAAMTIVHVVYS